VTKSAWNLVVAASARRAVDRLPVKIAVAVLDYVLGPLLDNAHRVGRPLGGDLTGLHAVRVGAYRIVCEINSETRTVEVIYIDHRADVYRPR